MLDFTNLHFELIIDAYRKNAIISMGFLLKKYSEQVRQGVIYWKNYSIY